MSSNKECIQHGDDRSYISAEELKELMDARDRSIKRIESATETKRKLMQVKTIEELNKICIPNEFKKYGRFAMVFMDPYVSGFALANDEGMPRCHYGSMDSLASVAKPKLYRGEIRDYGLTSGVSLLGRNILLDSENQSVESKLLSFFIEQIRGVIFNGFLTHFRQYHEFPFGEPLAGLIAQHYGLSTPYIDLTDDIKVALFFACCKHIGNNRYRPINESDIMEIGKKGIIYCGDSDEADIIGFQPFCRCHRQRGYYIDTASTKPCWDFALYKDPGFSKCSFDRTIELSERIFEEFDGGKALLPDDGLEPFSKAIEQIRIERVFPDEAFEMAYKMFCGYLELYRIKGTISNETMVVMSNRDHLITELLNKGFVISNRIKLMASKAIIEEMNINWDYVEFAKKEGFVYSPFEVFDK